jgi:RNA polymerase sigma factor (sigma-70 family)
MSARIFTFDPRRFAHGGAAIAQAPGGPGRGATLLRAVKPRDRGTAAASTPGPLSPREVERFKGLMLPHLDAAYGFARFLSRDAGVAEDLAQDAYLKAYRAFPTYRGGDPKAWLLAIVRSSFLDWARGQRAWGAISAFDTGDAVEQAASEADSPEEELLRAADVTGLRQAVDALPDPFRETLVLRELQEMSYRQIAEITAAPIGTVMSRLARARSLLVQALRPGAPGGEGAAS